MDPERAGEPARWQRLGRLDYAAGIETQCRVAAEREAGRRPDTLLLLEHPPTVTLGRRATAGDLRCEEAELVRRGMTVVRVGRGGAATYHGPGQLVGYPILRLGHGGRAVRVYVERLEEVLRTVAADFGIETRRRPGHPGVWVGETKLASIGIEIHRRITRHGFALNVDMDLEPFSTIVPCGDPGLRPIDLTRACGTPVGVEAATRSVVEAWRRYFGAIEEEDRE